MHCVLILFLTEIYDTRISEVGEKELSPFGSNPENKGKSRHPKGLAFDADAADQIMTLDWARM